MISNSYNCNILLGKILVDEKPLTEYNIDEKTGFIVVMITKVELKF
jgi:hypothetical protein